MWKAAYSPTLSCLLICASTCMRLGIDAAASQQASSQPPPADHLLRAPAGLFKQILVAAGVTMKSQKEITLANDLALRDRQDIYRNFLLYCMSGDTVALPMGSTVVVERDESEFARLSQLGEVLGLSQFDVAHVHKELAETAFRNQVSTTLLLLQASLICTTAMSAANLCQPPASSNIFLPSVAGGCMSQTQATTDRSYKATIDSSSPPIHQVP